MVDQWQVDFFAVVFIDDFRHAQKMGLACFIGIALYSGGRDDF